MLVLSRRSGEQIHIGSDITIVIKRIKGDRVRVGIQAPISLRVTRGELPLGSPPELSASLISTSPATASAHTRP